MKNLFILLISFVFTISSFSQGDDCSTAMDLGTLPNPANCNGGNTGQGTDVVNNLTNIGATAENPYTAILDCQGGTADQANPAADVWVSFIASANELDVNITSALNGVNIGIYQGNACGSLTPVFCSISANGNMSELFTPFTPGDQYFIQISGEDEFDTAPFTLTLNNSTNCAQCATDVSLTANPPPTNGIYQPGTTVEFCLTVNGYEQISSNWLHGISPTDFGSGWDMTTLVPSGISGNSYDWIWTSVGVPQIGWYADEDLVDNPNGDASDQYGEDDENAIISACWQITTVSVGACVNGTSANLNIETYADGETGSWTSVACGSDPIIPFNAIVSCCDFPLPAFVDPSCDNVNDGSVSATGQGGTAPYDYSWENSSGTIISTDNNLANGVASTASGLGNDTYTVTVTDANGCVKIIDITIAGPACPPCLLTGITANSNIVCPSTTYTTTGSLTFNNPPAAGTLTVTDCNGFNQVFNAPFVSPINYNIVAQTADGNACNITAVFSADPFCTINTNYVAPICPCSITNFVANIGNCNVATDTYGVNGIVEFDMPPTGGILTITVDNGTNSYDTIINVADFISPLNYSISGIPSDLANSTITAVFSADAGCTSAIAFVAPMSCACPAEIGTFNTFDDNATNTDYVLCFGDQFNYQSNGDYTPPNDIGGAQAYNPGIAYLLYSCNPTPGLEPNADPCFEGLVSSGPGALLYNDLNDLSWINAFPPGTFTDNIIYYVPITMYDVVGNIYSNVTVPNPPCYDLGPSVAVQYLPEVKTTEVEDCQAGTITSTVIGGVPEIDGSNYNIIPGSLSPVNASFVNTTTGFNGTIIIQGLTNGQNYSYNITDNNGCPVTVSGTFTGTEDPTFNYDNLSICTNGANPIINLTGTPGGTYTSTTISGGPTLSLNAASGAINVSASNPGVYDVTYTTPDPVCFETLTIQITILEVPIVNPVADQTVCDGSDFTAVNITGTAGSTFNWTNSNVAIGLGANGVATIPVFTGTNATAAQINGTITITPTLGTCTGTTTNYTYFVNPIPVVNAGIDQTVCTPNAVTLTATNPNGAVITWDNGVIDGTPFVPAIGTVTYTTTATLAGCISNDQVDVTANPLPAINAGVDQTVCEGVMVTLTATNPDGATITWDNGVIDGTSFNAPNGVTTTYTVTADLLTCLATDQVDVTVNPLPVFAVVGTNPTVCSGNDGFITLSGLTPLTAYQITYNDGVVQGPNAMNSDAAGNIIINGLTAGSYTDFTVSLAGCSTTDNTVINLVDPSAPTVGAGADQTVCDPTLITLTATNPDGATISWVEDPTGTIINDGVAFSAPIGTTTYTVTANLVGCISTDQVSVTVNPLPAINAGVDQTVCEGVMVTLTATNPDGATITWDNGVIDGTPFNAPNGVTTTYTVTADLLTCLATDQVDVTVNPLPVFAVAGTNPTVCSGNDGFITLSGLTPLTAYQITYNDGVVQGPNAMNSDAAGNIIINGLTAGSYTDFTVSLAGCSTTDNTVINLVDPSAPTVGAGADQTVCDPTLITLTATNPDGAVISWVEDPTGTIINDGIAFSAPIGITTYTVTANLVGCISTDQVSVTVNPLPAINAGVDQTVCEGVMVTLTATNPDGATITWDNGVIDGAPFNAPNGVTTTYTVTADLLTCLATDQVDVTVNPLPVFAVAGTDPTTCGGNDGFITLSGLTPLTAYQITYNDGVVQGPNAMNSDAAGNIVINGLTAGSYTDFTVSLAGCSTTDNTVINLVDPSAPTVGAGADQTVCDPTLITLTATNPDGAIISWVEDPTGTIINDGVAFSAPIGTTTYTVTANLAGCISTDQVSVTVNPLPNVSAGPDQTVCEGIFVNLTAINPDGATITWDNGVTNGIAILPPVGVTTTYTTTATLLTCVSTDQVDVLVNPLGNPGFNYPAYSYCTSEANPIANIDAIGGTFGFVTSAGGPNLAIDINTGIIDLATSNPGTYSITYTTNGLCPLDSTIVMNIALTPTVLPVLDQTVCHGQNFAIINFNGSAGSTFDWTNDNTFIGLSATGSGNQIPSFMGTNTTLTPQTGVITVTPSAGSCVGTDITFNLTVNQLDNHGFNFPITSYCTTDIDPTPTIDVPGGTFTFFTTNGAGTIDIDPNTGLINLGNSNPGSYDITYTTIGPDCPRDSTINITVNVTPNVNTVADQIVCEGGSFSTVNFTGIGNPTFTWTNSNVNIGLSANGVGDILPYTTTTGGGLEVATITVTPSTAACTGSDSTFILSVNPIDNPGFNYPQYSYCSSDVNPTATIDVIGGLFSSAVVSGGPNLIMDPNTGLIDLANSNEGVYDITYTTGGPCVEDSTVQMTINFTPTVNNVLDQTVCHNINFTTVSFSGTNGALSTTYDWVNTNPTIGLAVTGTGNITAFTADNPTSIQSIGTITVTPSTVECIGLATSYDYIINPLDDPTFNYVGGLTYCASGTVDPSTVVTGLAGGTYSFTTNSGGPLILNNTTGTITLATSGVGSYDITYTTNGVCPQTSTLTLVITNAPVADFTIGTYCANEADPMPTYINNGSGGLFTSSPAGLIINTTTGLVDLDASTSGTYTITNTIDLTAQGCILAFANDNITINEIPTAIISGTTTICASDALPDVQIDFTNITNGPFDVNYTFNGVIQNANSASPFIISGAAVGNYSLVDVTDANGCTNTANGTATIDLHPTPTVDFIPDYSLCEESNIVIQGFTGTPAGNTFDWIISNGTDVGFGTNGSGNIGFFTAHTPQTVTVSVTPTSNNGCIGLPVTFDVDVNPLPVVEFSAPDTMGCEPFTAIFTSQATNSLKCFWDFGDGETASGCGTVSHTYTNAGVYDVTLTVLSPDSCVSTLTKTGFITVTPMPVAAFAYDPDITDISHTEVNFTNSSINADDYEWVFGDDSPISSETSPTHLYPDVPAQYHITLLATNNNGLCRDSVEAFVTINDILLYYVPNVFTPDKDNYNETFKPIFTSGFDPFDYHLLIFNRWGEIIFESYNSDIGWDGTYPLDGQLCEDGVYIWKIDFKETSSDKRYSLNGHVTLLK